LGSVFSRSSVNAIEQQANRASELDYTLKINITGQMGRTRKTNYGFIEGLLIYFVVQLKQIHLFQSPTMKTQRQNTFSLKCQSVFPGKTK